MPVHFFLSIMPSLFVKLIRFRNSTETCTSTVHDSAVLTARKGNSAAIKLLLFSYIESTSLSLLLGNPLFRVQGEKRLKYGSLTGNIIHIRTAASYVLEITPNIKELDISVAQIEAQTRH